MGVADPGTFELTVSGLTAQVHDGFVKVGDASSPQ
jgi:hypothetical protein